MREPSIKLSSNATRIRGASVGVGASFFHIVLGLIALVLTEVLGADDWWALGLICSMSLLLLTFVVYQFVLRDGKFQIYEIFTYLAFSTALYLSFGPLLFVFGSREAVDYSQSFFATNASESVWITGLNYVGFGLAGCAYYAVRFRQIGALTERVSIKWARVVPRLIVCTFVLIGTVAKFIVVLPFELHLSDIRPTSIVRELANLTLVALFILATYQRRSGAIWARVFSKALLILEMVSGLLIFQKAALFLGPLVYVLGSYWGDQRSRKFLVQICIVLILYVAVNPVVMFGRYATISTQDGTYMPVSVEERIKIVGAYFRNPERTSGISSIDQAWWLRLNYIPAQHAAIVQWQQGRGGDSLELLPWLFVPRVVYKDKPVIAASGHDLYEKVWGSRISSTGIGQFVDGYYNFGWLGVILFSVTFGFVLRLIRDVSKPIAENDSFILFPLMFMGIYLGLRVDGWWLTEVFGSLVRILLLLGAANLSGYLLSGLKKKNQRIYRPI